MDKIEVLVKAKKLLSDPGKWYKGYFAVNKFGKHTSSLKDDACKWCMLGALRRVCFGKNDIQIEAENHLSKAVGWNIPEFNDRKQTTHQDIMNAFDKAIVAALNNQK